MKKGRLQQFDTPLVIYNQPANRFVAEFVGSPSMNFIEQGQVTIGIRPEHIHVLTVPEDGAIEARVYVTELMGNETFVFLSAGENRLIARAPAEFRAEVDTKVWLRVATEKIHRFETATGDRLQDRQD
jgi:ABC-type sugar transport system ATPase subunit